MTADKIYDDAGVLRATFYDWRTVKTRKQLQLIFEVPLEQQEKVLKILGAPMPDAEKWAVIGLLKDLTEEAAEESHNVVPLKDRSTASKERSKQHYVNADPMEQARIDCVMRCKDPHFWQWLSEINGEQVHSEVRARYYVHQELRAARYVDRDEVSRGDIAKNQKAYMAWREMEAQYLTDTAHAPSIENRR